jgi:hypothetical protein
MIDPTSRRFASPVVAHRVLDGAFASVSTCAMSAHGKMRPARARRRGQALLIAVLLMVFAAVLGATFVTVVALNLNQTARSGSINTARVAAIAGSKYVNDQLTNSPDGERWRPDATNVQTPATAGDTYYFTDYERAQGWDQADVSGARFVKFPDPRSTAITGNNTPTYLTKVETVDTTVDPSADPTRNGQLKVTIIGRASDNDVASFPLVLYKPTSQNGNMTSFARYDSNWNFGTNNLVKTTTSAASPSNNVIVVKSSSGFIPGRTILIGAADNPASVRIAIISSIPPNPDGTPGNQIYVTPIDNQPTPAPISIPANTFLPVRAASPYVGGLPDIDAQGTETGARQATATPSEYQDVLVTPPPLTAPTVSGGIMINNGVLFEGKSQFALNTTTSIPDRVLVAGLISINGGTIANVQNNAATEDIKTTTTLQDFVRYQRSEATDPTDRTQVVHPLTPARIDSPNSRWLQLTKLTGNAGAFYGYGGGVYLNNREDIEKVARLVDFSQPDVNKFLPRALTIAEMQRLWTRKSFLQKTADEYGNVNNGGMAGPLTQDASVPAPTPSNNKYQRLTWPRPGVTGDSYMYPMTPLDDPVDPTKHLTPSLEQQALRGWISPMQFLPRGALIELKGNKIVITRDDLSDQLDKVITSSVSGPNPDYHKPDAAKAWKTTTGGDVASGAKTYRMVIDMTTGARSFGALDNDQEPTLLSDPTYSRVPFNGVIYADGNVRVRGFTDATSKDITIVSMGNIYVEGGINQLDTSTPHKGSVALLAKRNVVLNPTQFATQPAGWRSGMPVTLANTAMVAPVTATATSVVDVTDTSNFRVGDVVTIGGKPTWWTVTNISIATGAGRITLSGTAAAIAAQGTFNTGEAIVALTDPAPDSSTRSESLSRGQAITRNLPVDGVVPPVTPYTLHLSFLQAGQNKTAFTLMNQSTVAANASTKAETNGVAGIQAIEKLLVADGSPATPYDLTTNTFGSLKLLFDGPGFPTPDPNLAWNFGVNLGFFPVPAYRVAAGLAPGVLPGASRPFLFTTSTDIHWRQNPTDLGVAAPAPTPDFLVGSPALAATDEDTNTVNESFYGTYDATTGLFSQAPLRGFTYLLPSAPTFNANNAVSLRHDLQAQPELANYLYGAVKYDRADLPSVVAAPISYNIQAAIYAQDGSWFVMAMPAMTIRPVNPSSPTPNEVVQANRYRRLNYQITVKANIAENFAPTGLLDYDNEQTPDQSPLVIAVPPVLGLGAQAQWLDSSAYPVDNVGAKWQTINYLAPAPLPSTNTLYLPITPDITNQR